MIKIIFTLLFFMVLTCNAFALISTNVSGAKLMSGPGENYRQIFDLPKYYPLRITAKSGKWYKVVDWMNMKGWIRSSQTSKIKTAVVNKINVNLRSGPGTRYGRVVRLYQGYILKIIRKKGLWYEVQIVDPNKNVKGWVYSRLLWI